MESKLQKYTPCCFLPKSAESLENKRVESLMPAKKRKRVRKSVKLKRLDISVVRRGAKECMRHGAKDL